MPGFPDKIKFYYRTYKRFGLRAILFLITVKFKKDKVRNIKIRNIKQPVSLSNFGTDVTTMFQIFFAGEYDVSLKKTPEFIIDCGANIGLSAVFFASKYPQAKIIAIEPDKNNFKYLQKNTAGYKNVVCLNKAIWSHSADIEVIDAGLGNWGFQTIETMGTDAQTVPGISIDMILEEYNISKIDILKIDIEGAEKELFSGNYENWLAKTNLLAIELHDKPGNDMSALFFDSIKPFPCTKYYMGENLICDFNLN